MKAPNFIAARLVSVESTSAEDEDADVARERRRVHEGRAQGDLLRVCDLTKVRTLTAAVSSSAADCVIAASLVKGEVASGAAGGIFMR